jgi:ferric-dicitrate binding protein FerR (iron transport regulator)
MSSIRFPTVFATGERKVTISGEAYFEIVAHKNNPFRVEITGRAHSEVEVLGTSFNINAYTDEEIIKTTLLEGSVKVSKQEGSAIIGAGEQAQFNSARPIKVVHDVDLKEVMAWKNGEFRFNGLTAEELLRQVARWYDVEVVYDANLPKVTFWGIVPRQENVSKLLEILAATKQLKFNLEDRKIYVKKYK